MTSLANKRVLIVGGSSGIGMAIASQAHAQGAQVTIASRSETKLNEAAERLGQGIAIAVLDTCDEKGARTSSPPATPGIM